ncbi:unnamed protein product [Auanema sp. JU1783]|nr:unnamed protein product [Auanema sp. JU1783]
MNLLRGIHSERSTISSFLPFLQESSAFHLPYASHNYPCLLSVVVPNDSERLEAAVLLSFLTTFIGG